jgi:integrase
MSEDNANEQAVKPIGGKKVPKPRRVGQRKTVGKDKHEIRVSLGRDSTGKRQTHFEVFYGGARQADQRIYEIKRRHLAGEPIKANADTFGAMLDAWLEAKRLSVAESSYETYKDVVDIRVRPVFGNKMLARITADDIQRFYGQLHDEGLSPAYIHYIHGIFGMVFKLAVQRKKLMGSPMVGVLIPKEWARDEDEEADARAMDAEQVAAFRKAAEGNRFENLFKLAFHVGFRPGELLALKWTDFDAQARTLRVTHNIVWRKAGDWYLKKPKTPKSRRALPLTDATIQILLVQRKRQLEDRLKAGKLWQDHGFIFADATGDPYSQWVLNKDCKRILKAAGLPAHLSPKATRHTMATLLLAGGTNPKAVQERMGHSRITTTLKTYVHVLPGMQEGVSEEIERLLNAKK